MWSADVLAIIPHQLLRRGDYPRDTDKYSEGLFHTEVDRNETSTLRSYVLRRGVQLAKHRLSNNVGGVKHFLSTQRHALEEERHFALVEDVPIQPKPARNQYSGLELGPTHASLRSQPRP